MSAQRYAVVVVHATIGLDQSSAEVLLTLTLIRLPLVYCNRHFQVQLALPVYSLVFCASVANPMAAGSIMSSNCVRVCSYGLAVRFWFVSSRHSESRNTIFRFSV